MDPNKLNGLNAEQKQIYFRAIADGAISAGDQQALRDKGVDEEIIKELCGSNYVALDPNDSVAFTYKKRKMTDAEKEQYQKQQNQNGGAVLGAAATIGGVIGFFVGGGPWGAAAGAAIGAGLFGATSCSDWLDPTGIDIYGKEEIGRPIDDGKKGEFKIEVSATVINNIQVIYTGMTMEDFALLFNAGLEQVLDAINKNGDKVSDKLDALSTEMLTYLKSLGLESLSAIKQLLEQLVLTNNANQESIKAVLDAINAKIDGIAETCEGMLAENKTIHEIITLLREEQGLALADIIAALEKNNISLEQIVTELKNNGYSLSLIIDELRKNGFSLADIQVKLEENNVDNKEILSAIQEIIGSNTEVGDKLNEVIKLLNQGLKLDTETQKLVNMVLDAVNNLEINGGNPNFDTRNIEKALAAILEAITKLPTKDDTKELSGENKELLESLLALVKDFMANEKAMDQELMVLITNFADSFKLFASYEQISDKELKESLGALKDEIITAIKNIKLKVEGNFGGGDVTVDLSTVEAMLAQMLDKMSKLPTAEQLNNNQKELIANFEALTKLLNCFMAQEAGNDAKTQELIANLSVAFDLFAAGEQIRDKELKDIVENLKVLITNFANQEDVANKDMIAAINEVLKAVKNIKINVEGGNGVVNVDLTEVEKMMAQMIEMMSKMPTADQMDANQKEMLKRFEDLTKLLNCFMAQEAGNDAKTQELIANLSAAFDLFAAGEQIRDKELKEVVDNLAVFVEKFAAQEKVSDEATLDAINNVLEAVKNLKIKVDGNFGGGNVTVDLSGVEAALASILAAINNLPTKDNMVQMNDDLIKAINAQTELINKFMNQAAEMDKATQDKISTFINNFAAFVKQEGEKDDKLYDLVSRMSTTLSNYIDNEAKMDEKEQALAQKILDAINNLDLNVAVNVDLSKLEAMMSILVEKAGKLDTTTEAILEAVLNGNKDFDKALDEIKDLIIKNNNIAQGTQDLVAKLGDKLDGLGDDIKAILLKILDEEQKQNVTSAEMLKVLNAIKNATDENGKTLLRIEEKLNLAAQSIDVLINEVDDMHEGTKALLIQILDKIPAACDCNIDEVLIKLEEIITVIKENPKDSNEGIVDDLDDLLQ